MLMLRLEEEWRGRRTLTFAPHAREIKERVA
jgi:hypothetical protein